MALHLMQMQAVAALLFTQGVPVAEALSHLRSFTDAASLEAAFVALQGKTIADGLEAAAGFGYGPASRVHRHEARRQRRSRSTLCTLRTAASSRRRAFGPHVLPPRSAAEQPSFMCGRKVLAARCFSTRFSSSGSDVRGRYGQEWSEGRYSLARVPRACT